MIAASRSLPFSSASPFSSFLWLPISSFSSPPSLPDKNLKPASGVQILQLCNFATNLLNSAISKFLHNPAPKSAAGAPCGAARKLLASPSLIWTPKAGAVGGGGGWWGGTGHDTDEDGTTFPVPHVVPSGLLLSFAHHAQPWQLPARPQPMSDQNPLPLLMYMFYEFCSFREL